MADIVEAGPAHANAIARLHAENWKMSYRGILPDAYLDKEVDGERLAYWQEALAKDRYSMVDKGYDQTIEHLHVSACARGTGLGRALMADAAHQTMAHGGNSLCLWVFEDNAKAIGFYEALGGVTDAHGTDKFAGGDAPDRRIGWRDLTLLVAVCEGEGK
jgi:GNAT superfamily N-acetyltransferase